MSFDLRKLRAKDVMNKKVSWATPDESLRAAAQRMHEQHIRALLVAGDEPNDLPGIVTSKDVVNLLGTQDVSVLEDVRVKDVMTRPAVCAPSQASVLDCLNLMRMTGVRRVPVLDGTNVIGILSTSDVFGRAMSS
jgi:CBS domain-containing protein